MLKPIVMTPAWRHGAMTPWGGEKLKDLYQKDSPGERAGECLEMSAIPGLESRDEQGRTLNELIAQHGSALIGRKVSLPFPLLLKLIDAKDQLSVQVHPGDEYAHEHHGKLGKNEAWVILHAEPGAQLTVGLLEGISKPGLEAASLAGPDVEGLLRRVYVQPGDVFYIPAGTVHAIGGGLVLYEIQQSSDVTYRLYDWGRVDKEGKGRELHLDHSLAVVDLEGRPLPALPSLIEDDETGKWERMLDTPYFQLDRLTDCRQLRLQPDPDRFSVLTAFSPMTLAYEGGDVGLQPGQTALLPADGYPLQVTGASALVARPAIPD
ncbi:MAG: class I mannose-6-phosphate isomerase [Clostridiales bacterium]|nr:class I mannose-6-phosphate isomerase [Clostridiales bacterium]